MTPQQIFDALCAPFPTAEVLWRIGSTNEKYKSEADPLKGRALAYVDARTVMDRLDSVVGCHRWQCSYTPGVGNSIVCNLGLFVLDDWIWKADGAGPSDAEPEKGALSDAFKRSAVRWGIGRYLYDLKAPTVLLQAKGKSKIIPDDTYARLDKLHDDFAKTLRKAS